MWESFDIKQLYTVAPQNEYLYQSISSSILYGLLLGLILVSFSFFVEKKHRSTYLYIVIIAFVTRCLFVVGNEYFEIIRPKKAGNFALWYYWIFKEGGVQAIIETRVNKTFYFQFLANLPGFELFGGSRVNLLLTNSFFTTAAAALSYIVVKKNYSHKLGLIILLILSIYPSAINFSGFGLRDPIIFFWMVVNILLLIDFYKNQNKLILQGIFLSFLIILQLRPESAVFIFLPYIFLIIKYQKDKFFKTNPRIFWGSLILQFLLLVALFYSFTLYLYGLEQVFNPFTFISEYVNERFLFDLRNSIPKSNILPPDMYIQLHWFPKWMLQSLGMIILPLPWLINDVWKFLVLLESIILILMLVKFWRNKNIIPSRERSLALILFFSYIGAICVVGIVVSNAGNGFRMRFVFAPYLLFAFAFYLDNIKSLPNFLLKNKTKA